MHESSRTTLCAAIAACVVLFTGSLVASANSVTVDCSGQTPGAFTAIQPAIDSLDVIGPNQVFIVPGQPCSANVNIVDRQRLTIVGANGTASVGSAVGPKGDIFNVAGSTGIVLGNLEISGGKRGIVLSRNSEVTIQGSVVSGNAAAGLDISDSVVKVVNSQFSGNAGAGVSLVRSRGSFQNTTANNNANGFTILNSSATQFTAPNFIQNNGLFGVEVMDGSSVRMFGLPTNPPQSNVIEGNSFVGLAIFTGHVALFGGNIIRNNGAGQPFSAGVRVDDNAALLGFGSGGNIQITGNNGAGIEATAGGNVDLAGTAVSNNTGDGINAQGHVHVIFFPPANDTVSGNGGRSITCDRSSVFVGDPSGVKEMDCEVSLVVLPGTQVQHQRMRDADNEDNDD